LVIPAAPDIDLGAYADSETVVDVTVESISPMLQHAMTRETVEQVLIRGERPPKDKTRPLLDIAKEGLYVGPNGEYGIPPNILFACLREAGRAVKFDGRKCISTADSTLLPSILSIEATIPDGDGFIPFVGAPKWQVDVRRGNLEGNGKNTAVGIVRPRFDNWSFKVRVVIAEEGGVTEQTVRSLFAIAGRRVGLGAFRPQKNGPFGRFRISGWTVVKAKKAEAQPQSAAPDGSESAEPQA
jgi:hypothetical protein